MKQIIRIKILIVVFCFSIFAQASEKEVVSSRSNVQLIAEFNDNDNEWYKLTPELLRKSFNDNSSAKGLIRIRNDKNFQQRLKRALLGLALYQMDLKRINFLVVNQQKKATNVLIQLDCAEFSECEDCVVIRATDIGKIEKLFRPKINVKRAKKK